MSDSGRLIATLAVKVAGYSSLIGADRGGTLEQLEVHRRQLVYPKVAEHNGHIVNAKGESLLAEFPSPTEAVRCAVELQRGMVDRNIGMPPERRIAFRVGVDIGEVKENGDDLVSRAVAALPVDRLATLVKPGGLIGDDSVSAAVRVAALAEPAGICISGAIRGAIGDQLPYTFEDIGKQDLVGGAAPVHCYAMSADSVASKRRAAAQKQGVFASLPMRLRSAAAAASVVAMVGIWGAAFWAWFGASSSTAPTPTRMTPGSQVSTVGNTTDRGAQAPLAPQSPPVANTAAAASGGIVPSSALQPQPGSNTVSDGAERALSVQPIAATVVVLKQATPTQPTLPDSATTVVRGHQGPPTEPTPPDSGTAVVRGNRAQSAPQTPTDSGTAVVRGNRAPFAGQTTPDSGTDVVRGSRAPL
jgi:adenylate cyclase